MDTRLPSSTFALLVLLLGAGCARGRAPHAGPSKPIISCTDGACSVDFSVVRDAPASPAQRDASASTSAGSTVSAGSCIGGCRHNYATLTRAGKARLASLEQGVRGAELSANATCPTCPQDGAVTVLHLALTSGPVSRFEYDAVTRPAEPAALRELSDYVQGLGSALFRCQKSEFFELGESCESFDAR